MRLFRYLSSLTRPPDNGRAVTIGAYDGIHLGHRAILATLEREAASLEAPTTIVSFEPTPREFFAPENPPARLTRFREKFECLAALGMDELFCPPFSSVRDLSPDVFIRELLVDGLGARHIVIGDDFRFAAGRAGGIEDLEQAGREFGFEVTARLDNFVPAPRLTRWPRMLSPT